MREKKTSALVKQKVVRERKGDERGVEFGKFEFLCLVLFQQFLKTRFLTREKEPYAVLSLSCVVYLFNSF